MADIENSPLHTSEVALDITAVGSISQAKNSVDVDFDTKKVGQTGNAKPLPVRP